MTIAGQQPESSTTIPTADAGATRISAAPVVQLTGATARLSLPLSAVWARLASLLLAATIAACVGST